MIGSKLLSFMSLYFIHLIMFISRDLSRSLLYWRCSEECLYQFMEVKEMVSYC